KVVVPERVTTRILESFELVTPVRECLTASLPGRWIGWSLVQVQVEPCFNGIRLAVAHPRRRGAHLRRLVEGLHPHDHRARRRPQTHADSCPHCVRHQRGAILLALRLCEPSGWCDAPINWPGHRLGGVCPDTAAASFARTRTGVRKP